MVVMKTTLLHLLTPHHTNNYRARILHPAGLSLLVAIFLVSQSFVNLLTLSPNLPGGWVLGFASDITTAQTVEQTNSERAKQGLSPLTVSSTLNQAAAAKANHMFTHDYWAHIAPDGTTPWVFIKGAGYGYSVAGENLARDFDTTGSMINAWMESPTHKDNIVNNKYTQIGVAVVNGTLEGVETTLVVQMFGKPATAVAQTSDVGTTDQIMVVEAVEEEDVVLSPTPDIERVEPTVALMAGVDNLNPPELLPATEYQATQVVSDRAVKSKVVISPLLITKSITAAIIVLMLAVLLYDLIYIKHKKLPRRVGKNWAHITILAFVLIFVLIVSQGKVI